MQAVQEALLGGLRKLKIIAKGKGEASTSYHGGAEERKKVKREELHVFKQPGLMRTHSLS